MTKQNEAVLLPCPFCGGEATRFTLEDDEFGNAGGDCITCTRCQCSSHVEFGRKENLVSRWNTRQSPDDEGMGWQTIESAPKDGTHIDVWYAPKSPAGEPLIPCRVAYAYCEGNRWYYQNTGNGLGLRLWDEPTHWRPLPDPPAMKGE